MVSHGRERVGFHKEAQLGWSLHLQRQLGESRSQANGAKSQGVATEVALVRDRTPIRVLPAESRRWKIEGGGEGRLCGRHPAHLIENEHGRSAGPLELPADAVLAGFQFEEPRRLPADGLIEGPDLWLTVDEELPTALLPEPFEAALVPGGEDARTRHRCFEPSALSLAQGRAHGGIFSVGTATVGGSIVAANTTTGEAPDVAGPFVSGGHNLVGDVEMPSIVEMSQRVFPLWNTWLILILVLLLMLGEWLARKLVNLR